MQQYNCKVLYIIKINCYIWLFKPLNPTITTLIEYELLLFIKRIENLRRYKLVYESELIFIKSCNYN